jgi:hypothetical protein
MSYQGESPQTKEGKEMTTETVNPTWIFQENVTRTYNGKTGCACGCAGTYTEQGEDSAKVTKRINFVNKNLMKATMYVWADEICYEVENKEGTRVTCVYVKRAN